MFLEIHTDRRRKNAYSYGLFRETFRENGPVWHRTRGRVTGLNDEQLLVLRDFVRSGCPGSREVSCAVSDSREWGAGHAVPATAKALGWPKLLYARSEPWVRYALALVDRAFRQLKTAALEVRPVDHPLDPRIEAPVFLCLLAYDLQGPMPQKLAPLFDADGTGEDRRWTWADVLERLQGIRRQTVTMQGTALTLTSRPDDEQQERLRLLDVALEPRP